MRTSTLFTVASLFLISSFSLPQPENLEASRTIEDREATHPDGPPHGGEGWWGPHGKPPGSGGGGSSNSTKIKEREAHHEGSWPGHGFPHGPPGGGPPGGSNSTKLKERQHGPPEGEERWTPGDVPPWMEFAHKTKHKPTAAAGQAPPPATTGDSSSAGGGVSGGGNGTKVKMVKFRD